MEALTYADPQYKECGPYETDDKPDEFFDAYRGGMAHAARIWAQKHMAFGAAMADIEDRTDYYHADPSGAEDDAFAAALAVTYQRSVEENLAVIATAGQQEVQSPATPPELATICAQDLGANALARTAAIEYAA